jgi:hypothetical protein
MMRRLISMRICDVIRTYSSRPPGDGEGSFIYMYCCVIDDTNRDLDGVLAAATIERSNTNPLPAACSDSDRARRRVSSIFANAPQNYRSCPVKATIVPRQTSQGEARSCYVVRSFVLSGGTSSPGIASLRTICPWQWSCSTAAGVPWHCLPTHPQRSHPEPDSEHVVP